MADNPRSMTRAVTQSMAGAVPFVSQDTRGSIDEGLARFLVGLQSQVYGLNAKGKPDALAWFRSGESSRDRLRRITGDKSLPAGDEYSTPGTVNDLLALPTMIPGLADLAAKGASKVVPGVSPLSADQLEWLNQYLVPNKSKRAKVRQEKLTKLLRESAALGEPQGLGDIALESAGAILGSSPLPMMAGRKAVEKGTAEVVERAAPQVAEAVVETPNTSVLVDEALQRLSKVMQGKPAEHADIDAMMDALRKIGGAGTAQRQELTRLDALRKMAKMDQNQARVAEFDQRLLNQLAEIYLSPAVKVTRRMGGRVSLNRYSAR